jgi:predicted nucleic acid-binding protein
MNILIDTNRYKDFCEGDEYAVEVIRKSASISIPFIVIGELRAGFACGLKGPENERILNRFLQKPRVHPLFADQGTTQIYASLYRQLRTRGTPVPTNDLWIAALAVQHNLILFSRDSHFRHLPQIQVV